MLPANDTSGKRGMAGAETGQWANAAEHEDPVGRGTVLWLQQQLAAREAELEQVRLDMETRLTLSDSSVARLEVSSIELSERASRAVKEGQSDRLCLDGIGKIERLERECRGLGPSRKGLGGRARRVCRVARRNLGWWSDSVPHCRRGWRRKRGQCAKRSWQQRCQTSSSRLCSRLSRAFNRSPSLPSLPLRTWSFYRPLVKARSCFIASSARTCKHLDVTYCLHS